MDNLVLQIYLGKTRTGSLAALTVCRYRAAKILLVSPVTSRMIFILYLSFWLIHNNIFYSKITEATIFALLPKFINGVSA